MPGNGQCIARKVTGKPGLAKRPSRHLLWVAGYDVGFLPASPASTAGDGQLCFIGRKTIHLDGADQCR